MLRRLAVLVAIGLVERSYGAVGRPRWLAGRGRAGTPRARLDALLNDIAERRRTPVRWLAG